MLLNIFPFQILFNGKLPENPPFSQYAQSFQPPENAGEDVINSTLNKSFRGRRLNGKIINISESKHSILMLSKSNSKKKSNMTIEKSLNQLTYWNYDDEIKKFDDIPQFLNAIYYFNVLHRET